MPGWAEAGGASGTWPLGNEVGEDFKKEEAWLAVSKRPCEGEEKGGGGSPASGPFCPPTPPPAHRQSSPTPLAWLSFLSRGPPYKGVVGGGASRDGIRWPTAHSAGARDPLRVAAVKQKQRALKWGRGEAGTPDLEGLCVGLRGQWPLSTRGDLPCLCDSVPLQQG